MASLGDLVVNIIANTNGVNKDINAVKKSVTALGQDVAKVGANMNKFVTVPILAMGTAMAKSAIDVEKQRTSLGVLLKDTEKGNKLFRDLQQLSSKTPLQLDNITKSAQRLLASGTQLNEINETITMLGDIALGDANKLETMTNAYSKMQAKGKATMEELNMVTEAGVPILQSLADLYDTNVEGIYELSSQGKIAFSDVQEAMQALTSETGQFNNGMLKLSETTGGKLSTALDNIKISASEFGELLLPTINEILEGATDLFKGFSDLDTGTKDLILTVGVFAAGIGPAITAVNGLNAALKLMSTSTGVIGLVLTGITAVASGLAILKKRSEEKNTERLTKQFGELGEQLGYTGENFNKFLETADSVSSALYFGDMGATFDGVKTQVRELSKNLGVTEEEIIKIGQSSDNLSANFQAQLVSIKAQKEEQKIINDLNKTNSLQQEKILNAKLRAVQLANQQAIDEANAKAEQEAKIQAYVDQNERVQEVLEANKTEIELIDEQIAGITELSLKDSKYREDQKKALEILQEKRKDLQDEEDRRLEETNRRQQQIEQNKVNAILDIETNWHKKVLEQSGDRLAILEDEKQQAIKNAEEKGAKTEDIETYYAKATADATEAISKEKWASQIADAQTYVDFLSNILASSMTIYSNYIQGQINEENRRYANEVKLLNQTTENEKALANFRQQLADEEREQSIQDTEDKIEQLIAKGDEESLQEARRLQTKLDNDATERELEDKANEDAIKRQEALVEADKKSKQKQYEYSKALFETEKLTAIAQAGVNIALGITKALASQNYAGAGITAGLGAVQIGTIASQQPPEPPQFATGAIIKGSQRGIYANIGEKGYDELLLGSAPEGQAVLDQFAKRIVANMPQNTGTIVINQSNMMNLGNEQGLQKAGELLYDKLEQVRIRRGYA